MMSSPDRPDRPGRGDRSALHDPAPPCGCRRTWSMRRWTGTPRRPATGTSSRRCTKL